MLEVAVQLQVFLEQVRAQQVRECTQPEDAALDIAAAMRRQERGKTGLEESVLVGQFGDQVRPVCQRLAVGRVQHGRRTILVLGRSRAGASAFRTDASEQGVEHGVSLDDLAVRCRIRTRGIKPAITCPRLAGNTPSRPPL